MEHFADIPYIDIHTHTRKPGSLCLVSYRLGPECLPENPGGPVSAGIHPWDINRLSGGEIDAAKELLKRDPVWALGEAGLDIIKGGDPQRQAAVLRMQMEVATARDLPVIIHCVKAYNELFTMIREFPGIKTIFHGYTGSPEQTARALGSGSYISMGKLSFESPKTVESLRTIPAERLFIETDESDMPIRELYNKAAKVKEMKICTLADIIENNFNRIFKNPIQ
ncbi:MAG: TatD family hydrolase [Rikenellaceae bacterium]|nr:TatD family hydrolase [Rikenellaceae bacterium]